MSPHPCSGGVPLTPAVRHRTTGWPTAQRDIARSDSFCTGPINAGLTTGVSAPAVKPAQPTVFLNEDEQLEQLHRCLTDSTIDIDLRAGGALMLLYGINLIRVLAITRKQISERSGDHYLNLTDHEPLLLSILAELLSQLPCPRPRSTLPEPEISTGLLFPGRTPNRPVDAGILANRLKQHGINPRGVVTPP